jgi:hypothetical protein
VTRAVLGMTYTQAAWVLCGVGLLVVEVIALLRGDPPLTDAMRQGSDRWLLWPALWGVLAGHFFGEAGGPAWGPSVLVLAGAGVIYRDLFARGLVVAAPHMSIFLLFLGLGAWLWGAR